jgi:hypothetical protein
MAATFHAFMFIFTFTLHFALSLFFGITPCESQPLGGIMTEQNDIGARARSDLQRAERDAASAREKMTRAEAEINDLRAFLRKLEHYAVPMESAQIRTRALRGSGGKAKRIADFCIEIIQTAGRRVEMGDLFPAVLEAGIEIGGTDEKSVLAGYLSRDKRLNFVRREGWGIAEPYEEALLLSGTEAVPSISIGEQVERIALNIPGIHSPAS